MKSSIVIGALIAAAIAALVSNFLVPLVVEVAVVLKAVDHPGRRKNHQGAVARLGGVAIVTGLLFGVGCVSLLRWPDWKSPLHRQDLVVLVVSSLLVFLVGLVDDVKGVTIWKKFLVQGVAAWLLVSLGSRWQFSRLGLPGGINLELSDAQGYLLTIVWIVGVTNAINLLDGLDGLATGVVAIIAASFVAFSFLAHSPFIIVLMSGVFGACLGFLPHNREPAKIFLGDAGSLTLGFLLAASSVNTGLKSPTAVAILVPLLALGVPVIDTLLVMTLRFLERPHGRAFHRFLRMFDADRNHLHHLLEDLQTSRRGVLGSIYALVFLSTLMAFSVALTKSESLGFVLVLVEIVVIAFMRQVGMAHRAHTIARTGRPDIENPAETSRASLAAPHPHSKSHAAL